MYLDAVMAPTLKVFVVNGITESEESSAERCYSSTTGIHVQLASMYVNVLAMNVIYLCSLEANVKSHHYLGPKITFQHKGLS